ncbi:hypothetical protein HBB16_18295 [Pseudonocardia sp. MCCB 268]|nr:hypothetical protein [Pseudonocardia cytotoxica]
MSTASAGPDAAGAERDRAHRPGRPPRRPTAPPPSWLSGFARLVDGLRRP